MGPPLVTRQVSKILIFDEICIFDERKMAFRAAKSGGDLEKALSHKFNDVTF